METFCEIILDLENDRSRIKEVSENLPEQMEYVTGTLVYKWIVQIGLHTFQRSPGDYRFLKCNFFISYCLIKKFHHGY